MTGEGRRPAKKAQWIGRRRLWAASVKVLERCTLRSLACSVRRADLPAGGVPQASAPQARALRVRPLAVRSRPTQWRCARRHSVARMLSDVGAATSTNPRFPRTRTTTDMSVQRLRNGCRILHDGQIARDSGMRDMIGARLSRGRVDRHDIGRHTRSGARVSTPLAFPFIAERNDWPAQTYPTGGGPMGEALPAFRSRDW